MTGLWRMISVCVSICKYTRCHIWEKTSAVCLQSVGQVNWVSATTEHIWRYVDCVRTACLADRILLRILMLLNFSKWPTWHTVLLFYNTFITVLYMFRATSCSSSGGQIVLTFRHRASCILGQAFRYSPENAFYIFNQQIYFII